MPILTFLLSLSVSSIQCRSQMVYVCQITRCRAGIFVPQNCALLCILTNMAAHSTMRTNYIVGLLMGHTMTLHNQWSSFRKHLRVCWTWPEYDSINSAVNESMQNWQDIYTSKTLNVEAPMPTSLHWLGGNLACNTGSMPCSSLPNSILIGASRSPDHRFHPNWNYGAP